jgi:xanthine dehydrogenase accessory factor
MENLLVEASGLLHRRRRLVLARIIRREGSAPRATGTQCIIREDGTLLGTIGGGFLEHRVTLGARDVLKDGRSTIHHFHLAGESLTAAGMICGGEVDVYLEPLDPENRRTVEVFSNATDLISAGRRGILVTLVEEDVAADDPESRMLLPEGGPPIGAIRGLSVTSADFSGIRSPRIVELQHGRLTLFAEPVEAESVVYLFGAGHVSTSVALLASLVGFRLAVIDDRAEFATRERFPTADEVSVLPFEKVFDHLRVTPDSYLVIVTRGHVSDRTVLRSALTTNPAYIGMIGSKRKREAIYQSLVDEGVPRERLEAVHSPIGVEIGAETPEEIAVSIVGELIKTRAERSRSERKRNCPA